MSHAYVTHKATFLKGEGSAGNTLLSAWVDVVNQSTHPKKNVYPNPKIENWICTQQTNIGMVEYLGPALVY